MESSALLVLSNHRPETVHLAKRLMARHTAVILEEPPDPRFQHMLAGELNIDTYLESLDLEYPEFSRHMSKELQELYRCGIRLYQIEPFLEKLIEIHEYFADGGRPGDFKEGMDHHRVYGVERDATAALIDFYRVSVDGSFTETINSLKRFARSDAQRFALRDKMRAGAIEKILANNGTYYIEAGQIHFPLWRQLKRKLPVSYKLGIKFLMADAVREMSYNRHLYGPGDLLTLHYRFHPRSTSHVYDLYAGRALIYNKLIAKEEIANSSLPYPHTLDELEVDNIVRQLTLDDCRRLFPLIRHMPTNSSKKEVIDYLNKRS